MTPSSQDLKSIKIIYAALIAGVLFFLIIAVVLIQLSGPFGGGDKSFEKLILSISLLVTIASILSGLYIFKKRTLQIEELGLSEKIETYRSAMIVRAATMEGSGFLFIVFFLIQGSNVFFLLSMSIICLMLYFFPTNIRLSNELKHNIRELER